MSDAAHARLSPSSADRWLSCPASVRMEEALTGSGVHEEESVFALEGTAAHELGEMKARLEFGQISPQLFDRRLAVWRQKYEAFADVFEEMEECTDAYVALIQERMSLYENSQVMFEQRLQTGIPESWGTSDTVIVSPRHVEIIDYKHGKGIEVQAKKNPQLRLYGLGALDTYGDILGETEKVRITVHQPRLNHVLTDEMTPEDLRGWRQLILPRAELALSDNAPFGPSEEACRWCLASGRCKAQLEEIFKTDFDRPAEDLSPEEIGEVLPKVKFIKDWLGALEEAALATAYSLGKEIPGYKVVKSGGNRKVVDPDGAIRRLTNHGYDIDAVAPRKIKGIGDLEKMLKKEFDSLLGRFIERGEGRPSLAPADDKREAIDPASEAQKVEWDQ